MVLKQAFQTFLDQHPVIRSGVPVIVAYSGGMDSHVLLHLCAESRLPVSAIHVHHGLQNEADAWAQHCQHVCEALSVPMQIAYVDARPARRQSPEEAAREVRYQAFEELMPDNSILLTAQHADDQSETVLLQLFRGAGAAGLSAMAESVSLSKGRVHLRPLFNCSRQMLYDYARQHHLQWVEDPSNQDTRLARNYLRHEVLPRLKTYWPSLNGALSEAARLQQENVEILDAMAELDWQASQSDNRNALDINALEALSPSRQGNLLRYWLRQAGLTPSRKLMRAIQNNILTVSADADPVIERGGCQIRRFRHRLMICKKPPVRKAECYRWQPAISPELPLSETEKLVCMETIRGGLQPSLKNEVLEVRTRLGGERIRFAGRAHHQRLKTLFQAAGIPPWQRQSIPLLYHNDQLIGVAGFGYADGFCVASDTVGWGIEWIQQDQAMVFVSHKKSLHEGGFQSKR